MFPTEGGDGSRESGPVLKGSKRGKSVSHDRGKGRLTCLAASVGGNALQVTALPVTRYFFW